MNLKNSIVLNEVKRHLSSNMVKIIIVMNIIISSISALRAFSSGGIKVYYYDEILYHYFWFGLHFLIFACLFVSMKVMVDSQKNYSLISRFSSKKEFIKKVFLINTLTIVVVVITCYMTSFLAFNILSSTSYNVRNLGNYESFNLVYVSNLVYTLFFLIRTLFLLIIINLFNILLIYIFKRSKVFLLNIILIYYLYGLDTGFDFTNPIREIGLNFLDLRHYFNYPLYEKFSIEVISSILIIIVLSLLLYLSINIVKHVRNIEQWEVQNENRTKKC